MYTKRIKIFIAVIAILMAVCLVRIAQMQVLSQSYYQQRIAELKQQRQHNFTLKTVRGMILDRNGKILAEDQPQFQVCISYALTSVRDERVNFSRIPKEKLSMLIDELDQVIEKCAQFDRVAPSQIREEVDGINNFVWNLRTFQAWRANFPKSDLLKNSDSVISVPFSKALADFEQKVQDPARRLELINKTDIREMHQSHPLAALKTDDDILAAQIEFKDINDVQITAKAERVYPCQAAAAQTIGWVGRPQEQDMELFENDPLSRYSMDDLCGREDGVEYACETILHGRRGQSVYNIDNELVSQTPTQLGKDVRLTLDIELQRNIEQRILDCVQNKNCSSPTAAVVVDVATGDILALVSTPVYDLNRARYDYIKLLHDPNEPLFNRTINKQYPPGSSIKPLILIAGLESGKITPDDVISCPAEKAPKGWPSCWIYNTYHSGHDLAWINNARNALKGSCNRYFSRLADRIESIVLQQWLLKFGYGQLTLAPHPEAARHAVIRNLRQLAGQISTKPPARRTQTRNSQPLPIIEDRERRYFGIGQGNLRVTPLQVADTMAAIARNGLYIPPRLYLADPNDQNQPDDDRQKVDLGLSPKTIATVHDGMHAVVNEPHGTAYTAFAQSGLDQLGITVYGKTGSTQQPDHAWFAGFASDPRGRSIALAVIVEGGQHGSADAAPLARDIIHLCNKAGYLGKTETTALNP